jgi:hypothetical protein
VPPKTKRLAGGEAQYLTKKSYHRDRYIRNWQSGSDFRDEGAKFAQGKSKKEAALEKSKDQIVQVY